MVDALVLDMAIGSARDYGEHDDNSTGKFITVQSSLYVHVRS